MAENSKIEWTDHTFNPWWGCVRVSPGCVNCYAETLANRYGHHVWGPAKTTERRTFGEKHWAEPLKWNKAAEQAGHRDRVFCSSMADVFEEHPALDTERAKLWALIEQTPHLDWQLLTKRPENMVRMAPERWAGAWPVNVWAGCSVENQEWADRRIPELLKVPARVRFLSCEPLVGPVDLMAVRVQKGGEVETAFDALTGDYLARRPGDRHWIANNAGPRIHWVIVGGESGHGARPMHPDWAKALRDQCNAADVAFFFKQWGEWAPSYQPGQPIDLYASNGVPYGGSDDPNGRIVVALPDGTVTDTGWNGGPGPHLTGGRQLLRIGKKAGGRLLGGREWNEMPNPAPVPDLERGD